MKIKVESEKIIKAVQKLDGIEIVLENLDDAEEAINLILLRAGLFEKHKDAEPEEVRVFSSQKYETTAVDYKMNFFKFIFENDISLDTQGCCNKRAAGIFSAKFETGTDASTKPLYGFAADEWKNSKPLYLLQLGRLLHRYQVLTVGFVSPFAQLPWLQYYLGHLILSFCQIATSLFCWDF